jgi:transposase-like protein
MITLASSSFGNRYNFNYLYLLPITFFNTLCYFLEKYFILKSNTFYQFISMSYDKKTKIQALEEVMLGTDTKTKIAAKYGISTKTLWQWCKNPPRSDDSAVPLTAQEVVKEFTPRVQYAQNKPLTTDDTDLINLELQGATDSLLVDQLASKKDRDYCLLYVRSRDRTNSYMEAYNFKNRGTAWSKSQTLMHRPHIRDAIRQLNLLQIKTFESDILPTCMDFLHNVVTADLYNYMDDKGNLKPGSDLAPEQRMLIQKIEKKVVTYISGYDGDKPIYDVAEKWKIELPKKDKAIELLGKIVGMWHESNLSLNFTQNNVNVTQQKATEGMEVLKQIQQGRDPLQQGDKNG